MAGKTATKRPAPTFDRLKGKTAYTKKVAVHLDQDAYDRHAQAKSKVDELEATALPINQAARTTHEERLAAARAELEQAQQELDDATVVVRFRSIGRKKYERLVDEHQPTEEQVEEFTKSGEGKPPYNPDTFPPVLISACAEEPEISVEQAQELYDEWNGNEFLQLFYAAMEVCTASRVAHLGKDYGRTNGSSRS